MCFKRVPEELLKKNGAETQTCTGDARIFSPALYYLSYLGIKIKG